MVRRGGVGGTRHRLQHPQGVHGYGEAGPGGAGREAVAGRTGLPGLDGRDQRGEHELGGCDVSGAVPRYRAVGAVYDRAVRRGGPPGAGRAPDARLGVCLRRAALTLVERRRRSAVQGAGMVHGAVPRGGRRTPRNGRDGPLPPDT